MIAILDLNSLQVPFYIRLHKIQISAYIIPFTSNYLSIRDLLSFSEVLPLESTTWWLKYESHLYGTILAKLLLHEFEIK